jgi:hypothetical protein
MLTLLFASAAHTGYIVEFTSGTTDGRYEAPGMVKRLLGYRTVAFSGHRPWFAMSRRMRAVTSCEPANAAPLLQRKTHAGDPHVPYAHHCSRCHQTVRPPSTTTFEPVIYDDASEHKKIIAP